MPSWDGMCVLPGFVYRRDPSFLQHIPDAEQRQVFEFDHPGNKEVLAQRDEFVKVRGGPAGVGTFSAACGVYRWRMDSPYPLCVPTCVCAWSLRHQRMSEHPYSRCRTYRCTYQGVDNDNKPRVGHLEVGPLLCHVESDRPQCHSVAHTVV